jgi:hypothetical protein
MEYPTPISLADGASPTGYEFGASSILPSSAQTSIYLNLLCASVTS